MNQNNNALDCAIVRDLLPLYHDKVVSEVTERAVAGHLETCAECAAEYVGMCMELPADETSPKMKFKDLLRTRRKYRIIAAVMAVVLVCGLLTGGYFLQAQFPVVHIPGAEFTVERIYRYETEEEYKYFIIITYPFYGGMKIETDTEVWRAESDGSMTLADDILSIRGYRPMLSRKYDTRSRILIIDCGWETEGSEIIKHDYKLINCFNNPVNTKELAEIETPAYVYEYDWHYYHGGAFSLDVENNWIGFDCEDGTFRYWDLDGNELDAPPATE